LTGYHFLDDAPLTLRAYRASQGDFAPVDTDLDSLRRYCREITDCLKRSLGNGVVGRLQACVAHRLREVEFLVDDFINVRVLPRFLTVIAVPGLNSVQAGEKCVYQVRA